MKELGLLLEPGRKRELFSLVRFYFDTRRNKDVFAQALGRDKDTLRKHSNGDIETLPLDLAERIYRILEKSEPRFRLESPDRYIISEDSKRGVGDNSIRVEDEFQQFLFNHLTYEEFEEISGLSRNSFNSYRQNKRKRIDINVYQNCFEFVKDRYQQGFPVMEAEIIDIGKLESIVICPKILRLVRSMLTRFPANMR